MPGASGLLLYSRPGCHLCDEMAATLRALRVPFVVVNVDEDAALNAAYGEHVPVLTRGDAEIARAPQSERTLQRALRKAGVL